MDTDTRKITRLKEEISETVEDELAVEEPLEIRLNYVDSRKGPVNKTISITMRTPGNDRELALGFLFTEGIITSCSSVEQTEQVNENVIKVTLREEVRLDLIRLDRNFYTTSSCGICGKASLEALSMEGVEVFSDNSFSLSQEALLALPGRLRKQQSLFRKTGGNHGVALFDSSGEILAAREDVGRHNAMDKLVGYCLENGKLPLSNHGILVSGRASFELMQKALMAGCPMLAAIGAPSSLAVELAEEFNMTLIGFLKPDGCNIYHGPAPQQH